MIQDIQVGTYTYRDMVGMAGDALLSAQGRLLRARAMIPDSCACALGAPASALGPFNLAALASDGSLAGAVHLGAWRAQGGAYVARVMPGFPGLPLAEEVARIGDLLERLLAAPLESDAGQVTLVRLEWTIIPGNARMDAGQVEFKARPALVVTETPGDGDCIEVAVEAAP